jgi:hypothetical protein
MPPGRVRIHPRGRTLILVLVACGGCAVLAGEPTVPVGRQVALMVATAGSDRNMASRAGGKVKVLVVSKGKDGPSQRIVSSFLSALGGEPRIAGLPHEESRASFTSPAALADTCRSERIAIVYLTPSLDGDVAAIARALDGVSVMTVSGSADVVGRGVVIGFDLVSGRPQIVINLGQARKQSVHFDDAVLRLASRVIQ